MSEWISPLLGTVIFFYGGSVFLRGALQELKHKKPGMMTLVSMAISVAFAYSLLVTLGFVMGMDFWWELATLVAIMLLGHWLEMKSIQNAQGALKELAKLLPDTVERIAGKTTETVALEEVRTGDSIIVKPGGKIPVDGTVIAGSARINESMLTGESAPVKKAVDARVIAGTIVLDGMLTIRTGEIGADTVLAGIMQLVEEAQKSKSNVQILADKAAYFLTYAALAAAAITGIVWSIAGAELSFILERVVTVLIIACPHALGLAIPLVTSISTTLAARNNLIIRKRAALEGARKITHVIFDKTGTLTKGEQGVVELFSESVPKEKFLQLVAAVEQNSEHPIAQSILEYTKKLKITIPAAQDFKATPGASVSARVGSATVHIGGPQLLRAQKISVPPTYQRVEDDASRNGHTIVYAVRNSKIIGALTLADVIRPESQAAVRSLKKSGIEVVMLTGDSEAVARSVAQSLGIDTYFAEVLPGDKAAVVKSLQAKGRSVAMVGDGVNDAPALTQADIGIAIGAGTDVAVESAGIVLASSDPRTVQKVITLSRRTYEKMIQNLAWATGYNVIALPLAAGVTAGLGFILSPAAGAALMSASTIIVAINAQLLRRTDLQK